MSEQLRVGVIGVGNMGANHARVYHMLRGVDLVGVFDEDASRAVAVAERFDVRSFPDIESLLANVQAVSVAVPTIAHLAVGMRCLTAGAHVLVEKPIATTVAEGALLVEEAERRKLVLQVGHVERFNPAVKVIPSLIGAERLLVIRAQRLGPPTPRVSDIDVVFDLAIHDLDVVTSFVGGDLSDLVAQGRPEDGPLDFVQVQARTPSGVLVSVTASKITQQKVRTLDLMTDRSYVSVNYLSREIALYRGTSLESGRGLGTSYMQGSVVERPVVDDIEPLYAELEHFAHCVRSGAEPLTSGRQALRAVALAQKIQEAVRVRVTAVRS